MADFPDDFRELIRDPKSGKLREPSPEGRTGIYSGPPRLKSRGRRLLDYLTDPYGGRPSRDPITREIQRESESPYLESPDDPTTPRRPTRYTNRSARRSTRR